MELTTDDKILYEDNHIIIVNKAVGEIVQGDKTGDRSLSEDIKSYLKEKYGKQGNVYLGVVHRIDRPVSGCVLFAKTGKAAARLSEMVKQRDFHKEYLAITYAKPSPPNGTITGYMVKNEKQNKSYIVNPESNKSAVYAELNYKYLTSSDRYHLIGIELITGRHHQIRAQLASIGCIIKGDVKYGAQRPNPDTSIGLHAYKIEFVHPVKKKIITVKAPFPKEEKLWKILTADCEDKF